MADFWTPSAAVAEAAAALFAEAYPSYRCACGWRSPFFGAAGALAHDRHRQTCQATWSA